MGKGDVFLDAYQQTVQSQLARLRQAVQGVTTSELNESHNGLWSIGQILEHLCLSHEPYLAKMEPLVANPVVGECEPEMTFLGKKIYEFAGPDKDVPVPPGMKPKLAKYGLDIIHRWSELHQRSAELAKKAKGADLNAMKFRNPVIGIFKMNMVDGFSIMETHGERHLRQIEARRKK